MNSNKIQTRKMPKKTIILIIIMSIICFIGFLFIQKSKSLKMEEVLHSLGHANVSDVKVINKLSVEDKETRRKSTIYKIVFRDDNLNKECVGFIHRSNSGKYSKDLDCK